MGKEIDSRILEALEEKPMSISEIARNLDEKKYEISKRVEILEEQGDINTHKIGRSTACLLNEEKKGGTPTDDKGAITDSSEALEERESPSDDDREQERSEENSEVSESGEDTGEPGPDEAVEEEYEDTVEEEEDGGPAEEQEQEEVEPEPETEEGGSEAENDSDDEKKSSEDEDSEKVSGDVDEERETKDTERKEGNAEEEEKKELEKNDNDNKEENRGEKPSKPDRPDHQGNQSNMSGVRNDRPQEGFGSSSVSGSKGPRTIGVVSGKGGVGKTVVSINLGAAMEEIGEKVILVDADAEMSNVSIQLGMHTYPVSLKQVVEQDVHIMSAMHVDSESGIRVVPTSLAAEEVDSDVLSAFNQISDDYTVLVDSPPGFERPIERVIETCDELLFVTTPELPAVTDTYKLHREARNKGKKVLGAVVNMYSAPKNHMSVQEIEKALEMPVIGVVDHSSIVPRSIFENKPALSLKPYSKLSRSFKKIASELTGRDYEVSLMERIKGFFL